MSKRKNGTWSDVASMRGFYILDDDKRPIPASRFEWHKFMDDVEHRRVGQTELHAPLFDEDVLVYTVFIGMPCGDGFDLFETFVIGSKYEHDDLSQTHRTWEVAAAIHNSVVHELKREKSSTPT